MRWLYSFLFLFSIVHAQKNPIRSIDVSYRVAVNRMDFFTGPGLTWSQQRIVGMMHVETGINRTIFQSSPFPRFSLDFGYNLTEYGRIQFVPVLNYSFSGLRFGNTIHFWNEYYVGYRVSFGRQLKIFQESMAGLIQERFKGVNHDEFIFSNWGYFGSIGVSFVAGH